jgi:hypothetical protein
MLLSEVYEHRLEKPRIGRRDDKETTLAGILAKRGGRDKGCVMKYVDEGRFI